MLEGVIECLVKRRSTTGSVAARFAMVMGDITAVIAAFYVLLAQTAWFIVALFGLIAVGFATFFVFRNTDLEYEYSYFEGEMRVDKIMGKAARKKLNTFDFSKLELMAPVDSPRFYNSKSKKAVNYSSRDSEDQSYGAILYDSNNEQVFLMFTPNEELLEAIKRIAPRKIYED